MNDKVIVNKLSVMGYLTLLLLTLLNVFYSRVYKLDELYILTSFIIIVDTYALLFFNRKIVLSKDGLIVYRLLYKRKFPIEDISAINIYMPSWGHLVAKTLNLYEVFPAMISIRFKRRYFERVFFGNEISKHRQVAAALIELIDQQQIEYDKHESVGKTSYQIAT